MGSKTPEPHTSRRHQHACTTKSVAILKPGQTIELHDILTPTSYSEGDETAPITLALEARALASRRVHCDDLVVDLQPAPASHFVIMVCDNCFINHIPEDSIINGFASDCSVSIVYLISLSDAESSEADVISITVTEVE